MKLKHLSFMNKIRSGVQFLLLFLYFYLGELHNSVTGIVKIMRNDIISYLSDLTVFFLLNRDFGITAVTKSVCVQVDVDRVLCPSNLID